MHKQQEFPFMKPVIAQGIIPLDDGDISMITGSGKKIHFLACKKNQIIPIIIKEVLRSTCDYCLLVREDTKPYITSMISEKAHN